MALDQDLTIVNCSKQEMLRMAMEETGRIIADDAASARARLKMITEKIGGNGEDEDSHETDKLSNKKQANLEEKGLQKSKKEGNKDLMEFFTQAEGKCNWIPIEAPHKTAARYMEFFLPSTQEDEEAGEMQPFAEEDLLKVRTKRASINAGRRRRKSVYSPGAPEQSRMIAARRSIIEIAQSLHDGDDVLTRRRKNNLNSAELDQQQQFGLDTRHEFSHPESSLSGSSSSKTEAGPGESTNVLTVAALKKHCQEPERKKPCALCEKKFPISSLTASISRQAIYHLRERWSKMYGSHGNRVEIPEKKFRLRLYDELKVCLFCSQLFEFYENDAELASKSVRERETSIPIDPFSFNEDTDKPFHNANMAEMEQHEGDMATKSMKSTDHAAMHRSLKKSNRSKNKAKKERRNSEQVAHDIILVTSVGKARLEEIHFAKLAKGLGNTNGSEEKSEDFNLEEVREILLSTRARRANKTSDTSFSSPNLSPPTIPPTIRHNQSPSPRHSLVRKRTQGQVFDASSDE